MTVTASTRNIAPIGADFVAATTALVPKPDHGARLNQPSSINKAAPHCIYLLSPRRSIKHPIGSTNLPSNRAAPKSKSP